MITKAEIHILDNEKSHSVVRKSAYEAARHIMTCRLRECQCKRLIAESDAIIVDANILLVEAYRALGVK